MPADLSIAALVIDGLPVCAVQEERLSRHKGDSAFPRLAIEWCLEHAGLEPDALDAVVFYERPMLKFDRILTSALRAFPRSWRSFPQAGRSAPQRPMCRESARKSRSSRGRRRRSGTWSRPWVTRRWRSSPHPPTKPRTPACSKPSSTGSPRRACQASSPYR